MLEADEYARRWNEAARAVFWKYVVPCVPFTWGGLGFLLMVQPLGRMAAGLWFCWMTMAAIQAGTVAAWAFAKNKAHRATIYEYVWKEDYTDPWVFPSRHG